MKDMKFGTAPRRLLHWVAVLAFLLGAGGCSCDGSPTSGRLSKFSSSLEKDRSGRADYLIDFGEVSVGDRKLIEVQIRNEGSTSLSIHLTALGAPFGHGVPSAGATVPVGGGGELAFSFLAVEETDAPVEGLATLTTNEGSGKEYTIRLLGRGRVPKLVCDPMALDFGDVVKGSVKALRTSCTNELSFPIEVRAERIAGESGRSFSIELEGAEDGSSHLPAGGSLQVEVRLKAESVGSTNASLTLRSAFAQELASLPLTANVIETNLAIDPVECLEFGYVGLGMSAQRAFQVRTVGTGPLSITGLEVEENQRSNFSILSQPPLEMAPGQPPKELLIQFHPVSAGPLQAKLAFQVEEPGESPRIITACARGFGGGPSIRCDRESIDFGMAALGIPRRRTFSCINDGVTAPGEAIDPLIIDGIRSTHEVFEARIVDGGPKPGGYQEGESFVVEVLYLPTEERFDAGMISIDTASAPGGSHVLAVSGQGRDLPACEFALEPPQLRFGVVDRGEQKTLGFTITNLLETSCLISELDLSEGSDPAYSLEAIESHELGGHERLIVEVSFSPVDYDESVTGAVEFEVSDPLAPSLSVPLHGSAARPCLVIEPPVLDFGATPPGCRSRAVSISMTNYCIPPIELASVGIEDGAHAGSFQILQRPVLPKTLRRYEKIELSLAFLPPPLELGLHRSSLLIALEDSEPYVVRLLGVAEENPLQTDRFVQAGRAKVDILWVMDNSGSFDQYQDLLAENMMAFLDLAQSQQIDYHIAVTTSGLFPFSPVGKFCPGGARGGEDGRFFPIDGSHPRILKPTTPGLLSHWQHNMRVGTCHGHENYIEAAYRALREPLINEVKSSEHYNETSYNDGNAGFLRQDASLSIIFVADQHDEEAGGFTLENYLYFFRSVKRGGLVRIHLIGGHEGRDQSPCRSDMADRIHYLRRETGGTWIDICTPSDDKAAWASGLKRMSEGVFGHQNRYILRGIPADINGDEKVNEQDLVVHIDGERVELSSDTGGEPRWTYDPISNSINFAPLFMPDPGSEITVSYEVSCLAQSSHP